MSTNPSHYRCPACDFGIHNRRYPRCERCAVLLPASLLYSADEIARLDADAEASELARAKREASEVVRDEDRDAVSIAMMSGAMAAATSTSGDCGGGTASS